MILLIISLLLAYWFKRELNLFPIKLNQQLFSNEVPLNDFLEMPKEQTKQNFLPCLFFVVYPIAIWLLQDLSLPIIIIGLILIYLSVLDYFYYLTDIRYIAIIFLLSLANLLFYSEKDLSIHLFSLFITSLFFCLFIPITNYWLKKEGLGLGDVLLFCALSPLFDLEKMVLLLLFSSLSGLIFSFGYFVITKQKLHRLPFIPFISLSALGLVLMFIR
ncbi:peptidase [Pasteurellaceae bacterium 15-036681]|nr:peptidase [Pasteurellaceae bacterium 15-036681]